MIRSSVRSAGLAILLTMNGCGGLPSSGSATETKNLNVAEAALQGGAGEIALRVSDGVLHGSPHNTRAMAIKGDALTALGNYDEATAIYQALLAKDPNSGRANTGLGRIRLATDPAAAAALFQQVLNRDPKDMTALNDLGIARDLQGRHAEAQTAYRQVLAVNADLDSAQVNLALSLAMSGQGPAAIQLLKDKASQPGAPVKVKHDYAVVLAMAGHRPEAERVLSQDLSPDEARQVLDNATGTHTSIGRDGPTDSNREALAARQPDDDVRPDVVQVPEDAPQSRPLGRAAQIPAAPAPGTAQAATAPAAMAAAPAAQPPMVVRPRPVSGAESDSPVMQPVGPLAAAVTNERTLALPIQSTASIGLGSSAEASPDPAIATPADVVAMPPGPPVQRMASGTAAAASAVQVPLPVAPPVPGVPGGAPLAPADRPATAAALAELPARTAATAPTVMADAMPSGPSLAVEQATQVARPAPVAAATVATAAAAPDVAPKAGPRPHPARAFETEHATVATQTPITRRGKPSPTVQFAAAATEEAAFAFWQDLSHRFPEALAQREPLVMRFKLDGTVFWRVRAEGFGTISEAQAVCARMRADGQDCFAAWS